jgi:hypothetical protein
MSRRLRLSFLLAITGILLAARVYSRLPDPPCQANEQVKSMREAMPYNQAKELFGSADAYLAHNGSVLCWEHPDGSAVFAQKAPGDDGEPRVIEIAVAPPPARATFYQRLLQHLRAMGLRL